MLAATVLGVDMTALSCDVLGSIAAALLSKPKGRTLELVGVPELVKDGVT